MNTSNRFRVTCPTLLLLFSLSMAVLTMVSCSGKGNYGRLVPNDKVKSTFETYQLSPDYTYYYSGPDAYPRAVIGIRNEYHLESKFWKAVDLTPTLLKRWLEIGGRPRQDFDLNRNGSEILTPDGRQIGIWYALKNWKDRARVEMIDDTTVAVSTPIGDENRQRKRPGSN